MENNIKSVNNIAVDSIFNMDITALNKDNIKNKNLIKSKKKFKERNVTVLWEYFMQDPTNDNFKLFYERMKWGLRKHIYKIIKTDDGIDDILSKTMENAFFKRDQYDKNKSHISTWMYKIAFNNSLLYLQNSLNLNNNIVDISYDNLYDSSKVEGGTSSSLIDDYTDLNNIDMLCTSPGNYKLYTKDNIIDYLYDASIKCIEFLPDNLKIVMSERVLNNKKLEEIASDNNIPITSVKNWLRRGRIELNRLVQENYNDLYKIYKNYEIN